MDLKAFKHWMKPKSFEEKLRQFGICVESMANNYKDYSHAIIMGWDPELFSWYFDESLHQKQRANWLFEELLNDYEHVDRQRIIFKKGAKNDRH